MRVRYPNDDTFYTGFIVEIASESKKLSVFKMYCTEREAYHILNPRVDFIEVISESGR